MITAYISIVLFILLLSLIASFSFQKPSIVKSFYSNSLLIVVPFRNEEERIHLLLNSLLNLKDLNVQVALIDDHSTDKSLDIIKEFLEYHQLNFIQLLELPTKLQGKKAAQKFAAQNLKADWIYFADADTEISIHFIEYLFAIPATSSTRFVQGFPILYSKKMDIKFHVLYLEFLTLVGFSFIARFYKFPILANGAIMAMQREAYLNLDLKENFASGDDIFAMRGMLKKFGLKSTRFVPIVTRTYAPKTFAESILQKKRWISKWTIVDYIAALLGLIFFYSGPALVPLYPEFASILLLLFPISLMLVILSFMILSRNFKSLIYLPFIVIILPLYLGYVISLLRKSGLSWKNRPI